MAPSAAPFVTLLMAAWGMRAVCLPLLLALFERPEKRGDVYNVLWVLVFGFATINILGLVARRFDTDRNRMNFGELLAILVVVVAVVLLSTELLHMFKIFPIQLRSR